MRRIVLIIVFLVSVGFSFGQKPDILCTQVNEDGSTTIHYRIMGEGFIEYTISALNNSSNEYEVVGTETNFNIDNYTDNSHNANNNQVGYRISGNGVSFSYANTIYLTLNQESESSFNLSWASPHLSPSERILGTENQKYIIYRRFANQSQNWTAVDSTMDLSYIDNFPPPCSDTVYYKVELPNVYGCSSVSNLRSHFVEDTQIPIEPRVLSSSVDFNTQKLVLSWIPSPSIDTKGYVVCQGTPCIAIDTIMGKDEVSFICDTCNTDYVFSLAVMAFDSCYNTSLKSNNHKNIVLSYNREVCSDEIDLSWTNYSGEPLNVNSYNLYLSQNDGEFILHRTFTAQENTFTYITNPIIEKHSFYIKALLSNDEVSNSNRVVSSQGIPNKVDFAYIRKASLSEDNTKVELDFLVDASLVVRGYDLYRSVDNIDYNLIKTIEYSGENSFSFIDSAPQPGDKTIYYYKLMVPDECELLYYCSNIFSTIKLSIDASDADINILSWNELMGWESVQGYDIYRSDEAFPLGLQLGSVLSASFDYEDNISSMVSSSDKIEYYIIANEGSNSPESQRASSRSSTAPLIKESLVFIPNAFCPTDITNNEFKPYCSFIRTSTYVFRVLSRWGEVVFETRDMDKGWDGRFKGKLCSAGSYPYVLEFVNSEGEKTKKSGFVNLIN